MHWLVHVMVFLLVSGCAGCRWSTSVESRDLSWRSPGDQQIGWRDLPFRVKQVLPHGLSSPDGRWTTVTVGPQLWLMDTVRQTARLVEPELHGFGADLMLWSPRSTVLYYRTAEDSWQEVNPASGEVYAFLPGVLKGVSAGNLRFSPDGQQLLYNTGVCYECNKPSPAPQTTYLVNADGTGQRQIGVDVEADWDGNRIEVVVPEPNILYISHFPQGPTWTVRRGEQITAGVRGAASVHWRMTLADTAPGNQAPLILPARHVEPGVWTLDSSLLPERPVNLTLFAEVRPGVPVQPSFIQEGLKVWKTEGPYTVRLSGGHPKQG
jgi:hypothetical protein